MTTSPSEAIRAALSPARMVTYEVESTTNPPLEGALQLYAWNSRVSAALMVPLSIAEVVIRNAVHDALQATFGERWPWHSGFVRSLPERSRGILVDARDDENSTGKVVAELNFGFWQRMFTGRFDGDLWNNHLDRVMPNMDLTKSIQQRRSLIQNRLEHLRLLRNRIAHHEPLLKRNLHYDFEQTITLISWRCQETSQWTMHTEDVLSTLNRLPN